MSQRHSGLPFDDIRNLAGSLPNGNDEIAAHTLERLAAEVGADAGRIGALCEWYSMWSGRSPVIHRPSLTLFAGTHRLQNRLDGGQSAEHQLTRVNQVAGGDAVVNRLCNQHGLGLKLFDLALQMPVGDISVEAALDEKGCAGTIAFGMEAIAGGSDLLTVCALGPRYDASSLAILSLLAGLDPEFSSTVDKTMGEPLKDAIGLAKPNKSNPLEVLRRLGGRETSAICGAILAARTEHIPTVVAGIVGLAACAILYAENPQSIKHCVFASGFDQVELDEVIQRLGLLWVMDKPVSMVEEANAVIAASVVQSACKHFPIANQATNGSV